MLNNRTDFGNWLRRQIFQVGEDENGPGKCKIIEIRHVTASNRVGNEVASVDVPSKIDDLGIDIIINEIENITNVDAGALGGTQRYVALPYFKSGKTVGRYAFRVQSDSVDDEELDSEPPTKSGHLAQLMRHQEAILRTAIMGVNQVIGIQSKTIMKQSEQIEKHQDVHFQLVEMVESLKDQRHQRDLETKLAEFKQKQYEMVADKINILLPSVVNRISGKKLLPEKTTPMEEYLKSILESLTPAQIQGLQGILRPEQAMALADMMDVYNRQQEFKKEQQEEQKGNGATVKQPES